MTAFNYIEWNTNRRKFPDNLFYILKNKPSFCNIHINRKIFVLPFYELVKINLQRNKTIKSKMLLLIVHSCHEGNNYCWKIIGPAMWVVNIKCLKSNLHNNVNHSKVHLFNSTLLWIVHSYLHAFKKLKAIFDE